MRQNPPDGFEYPREDGMDPQQSEFARGTAKDIDIDQRELQQIPPELAPPLIDPQSGQNEVDSDQFLAGASTSVAKMIIVETGDQEFHNLERGPSLVRASQAVTRTQGPERPVSPGCFAVPARIGRFEISELLGIGGFGIVYRGIDPVIGREVAIKVPRPEILASAELIERFGREATAAAQLEHPNIVPVFESDCHGATPYIVTPYISGTTLGKWRTEQSNVSPRMAAEIVRQLAQAVAHAHDRGVLHRDLKPGNVLIAPFERNSHATGGLIRTGSEKPASSDSQKTLNDQSHEVTPPSGGRSESVAPLLQPILTSGDEPPFIPKLTDFGLAKCNSIQKHETRTGTIFGTTCYMSPEQAEGRSRDITARSDIYGLGAILYELLKGIPPFRGINERETIQNILRNDPVSLQDSQSKIPTDLEVICLKCLEKSPANRYPSAAILADDLQRFLNGEPIWARPISQIARIGKWCRRHPMHTSFLASAVLGLLTLVSVSLWYNSRLTMLLDVTERERRMARKSELVSRQRAYVSDMRNAHAHWHQANIPQVLKLLDRYQPRDDEPDLRDFAWWSLWREYKDASRVLGKHQGGANAVAISRKGDVAASGGEDSLIRLWSLPSGKKLAEMRGHESGAIESLDFSPSGERLVSAGEDGTVRFWDVNSRKSLFVRREHQSLVSQVVYSPRGDVVASGGGDRMIRLWNPESGEPIGTLSGHTNRVRCLAFHPLENTLASGGLDGTIRIWDLNSRLPDQRFVDGTISSSPEWSRSLIFDPEGTSLMMGTIGGKLVRLSFQDSSPGMELHREALGANPRGLCWPRGGSFVLGMGNSEILVADRSGLQYPRERLKGHLESVLSVAASDDGTSLISAARDGQIRYWPQFKTRSRIKVEHANREWNEENQQYSLQWRDRFLAADFNQRKLSIFRMPEGEPLHQIPKSNEESFLLSPSGKLVLFCDRVGRAKCVRMTDQSVLWTLDLSSDNPNDVSSETSICEIDKSEHYVVVARGTEALVISLSNAEILHRLIHPKRVSQVTLFQKGGEPLRAVSACHDGEIRIWNIEDGTLLQRRATRMGATYYAAVSGDHQWLAISGSDNKILIWNIQDLTEASVISTRRYERIEFLPGSDTLLRYNDESHTLTFWSRRNEAELMVVPEQLFGKGVISPDGNQIAIPQRGWIRLIDATPTGVARKK